MISIVPEVTGEQPTPYVKHNVNNYIVSIAKHIPALCSCWVGWKTSSPRNGIIQSVRWHGRILNGPVVAQIDVWYLVVIPTDLVDVTFEKTDIQSDRRWDDSLLFSSNLRFSTTLRDDLLPVASLYPSSSNSCFSQGSSSRSWTEGNQRLRMKQSTSGILLAPMWESQLLHEDVNSSHFIQRFQVLPVLSGSLWDVALAELPSSCGIVHIRRHPWIDHTDSPLCIKVRHHPHFFCYNITSFPSQLPKHSHQESKRRTKRRQWLLSKSPSSLTKSTGVVSHQTPWMAIC